MNDRFKIRKMNQIIELKENVCRLEREIIKKSRDLFYLERTKEFYRHIVGSVESYWML